MTLKVGQMVKSRHHTKMSLSPRAAPIQHIKKVWEKIAPLALADKSWDNVRLAEVDW